MVLRRFDSDNNTGPPNHFACYNHPVLQMHEDEWDEWYQHKMIACLFVHAVYSSLKSQKDTNAKALYKYLLLHLKKKPVPKAGHLVIGHSMAIMW